MRTTTDAMSPSAVPAVPLIVGVVSLIAALFAGDTTTGFGAVVSIVKVSGLLVASFPRSSAWVAVTV